MKRQFSSFPMTGHLHNPALRFVSLHPHLSITLSLVQVPEIHDGFLHKMFISQTTTVLELKEAVILELGLTTTAPFLGGGNIQYVMEEAWVDGKSESLLNPFSSFICLFQQEFQGFQTKHLSTMSRRSPSLQTPSNQPPNVSSGSAYPRNGINVRILGTSHPRCLRMRRFRSSSR